MIWPIRIIMEGLLPEEYLAHRKYTNKELIK